MLRFASAAAQVAPPEGGLGVGTMRAAGAVLAETPTASCGATSQDSAIISTPAAGREYLADAALYKRAEDASARRVRRDLWLPKPAGWSGQS